MRVLVTWGSKLGGTEGIARTIAEALEDAGVAAIATPAAAVDAVHDVDAVIVGGALYAQAWHADARRFVDRHQATLRGIPVWFFSSGPLDDSADRAELPPVRQVRTRMAKVGAQGHVTFGGRLAADATGFPAAAMAKEHAGDWRNPARIRAWATEIARALPDARPRPAATLPGHAATRLVGYGALAWAACAAILLILLAVVSTGWAHALRAIATPVIVAAVARAYFRPDGARDPVPTAAAFTAIAAALDALVVAGAIQHSGALLGSVVGYWLPLALVFGATWATGWVAAMLPLPTRATPAASPAAA